MPTSYLEAKTHGIGQLITQRKVFFVPDHQRDFAWDESNVQIFFEDIESALKRGDPDYFIGTIVLLGPENKAWKVLDGQQRLATVSIFFSSIRNWLNQHGFESDADQIDSEFLKVRLLGGKYSERLRLNITNRETFEEFVLGDFNQDKFSLAFSKAPKHSSNYLLLTAINKSREMFDSFIDSTKGEVVDKAKRLFKFSSYLEENVKVVVLDVSSEANAYILFESLNARGNELSILDLVKNYVFGESANPRNLKQIQALWKYMSDRIADKDADDFLKVFWTSRFGGIRKPQLYDNIKRRFQGQDGALKLCEALAKSSDFYIALDEPNNELWLSHEKNCSEYIGVLNLLGSRVVRAPILSSLERNDKDLIVGILKSLINFVVRYQTVGQRRTGILEIVLSKLAADIFNGKLETNRQINKVLSRLLPTNDEFYKDFLNYSDRMGQRTSYILAKLDLTEQITKTPKPNNLPTLFELIENSTVTHILPKPTIEEIAQNDPSNDENIYEFLGNKALVENSILVNWDNFFQAKNRILSKSKFHLTRLVQKSDHWDSQEIKRRQERLAKLALKAWPEI